jgi:hypothetical protein
MGLIDPKRALLALGAVSALLIAGCGSDSSGQTATQVSIATPTSPVAPATTATAPAAPQQQGKTPTKASTVVSGPGGCQIPDTYKNFKFSGIDCPSAVAVAVAWDKMGNSCNTIDNPNSPQGFNRTCSVNGYTCTAKRDVRSDARFVSCTQGGKSIRFTWLPT